MIPWKKQMKKLDKNTAESLSNFRNELNNYIILRCNKCKNNVCTKCTSFGSTNLTSDIDITINSGTYVLSSIKKMVILLYDLINIFKTDKLFFKKNKFLLKNVNIFLI